VLRARRDPDLKPVPVKSVDQQALQGLHRIRQQWIATRRQRINLARALLAEFGSQLPAGASGIVARLRSASEFAPPAARASSPPGSASRPESTAPGRRAISAASPSAATRYLRMLLIHGARAALLRAHRRAAKGAQALTSLKRWMLDVERRTHHNKAAVALANKMARIVWAVWTRREDYCAR
jgi:transposase